VIMRNKETLCGKRFHRRRTAEGSRSGSEAKIPRDIRCIQGKEMLGYSQKKVGEFRPFFRQSFGMWIKFINI
jgi:hypothetical protein